MTEDRRNDRIVPKAITVWAWATVAMTFALLILGQLVTSFQAGMADPIWPTEPWYLLIINWQEPSPGYLIEHSHRVAGFTVGGMTSLLALALLACHPRRIERWLGLAAVIVLLAAYGQFHRELIAQRHLTPDAVQLPRQSLNVMLVATAIACGLCILDLARRTRGRWARTAGLVSLIGVMVQGLLGGFRVLFDAWMGTNLAAVHGVFAQVVLGLLVVTATAITPTQLPKLAEYPPRRQLAAWILAAIVFLQIVWGAWLRHHLDPIAQRLHVLTAFIVWGVLVGWVAQLTASPAIWRSIRYPITALAVLLAVQLYFGVEAWLIRFGAGVPPEVAPLTLRSAVWRTIHALTGSGVWVLTLMVAILMGRAPTGEGAERINDHAMGGLGSTPRTAATPVGATT